MKNYIQKWKALNKNGLKLTLVCSFNWLIGFVARSQFYFFFGILLVLLGNYQVHDLEKILFYIVAILFFAICVKEVFHVIFSNEFKLIRLLFVVEGVRYAQHLSEFVFDYLPVFCLISIICEQLVPVVQPILFENYLFKKVINREYLWSPKLINDLSLKSNIYTDEGEEDANKRLEIINKKLVKKGYQEVLKLSFLNKETKIVISSTVIERNIPNVYLVFRVCPFGRERMGYTLIEFKIS